MKINLKVSVSMLAEIDVMKFINPNALIALTLLIAESNPNDKNRMVGLVLLMLRDG